MITLATDFGSPYPAAMKGVIRRRSDAEIVDVAHDLPRGDPRAAAFWLRFVLPEFPPAIHCAVVDPGVGTDRAAIAVHAGGHVLVAPDNGLVLPPARALAAETGNSDDDLDVFEIRVGDPASATFHGRDVFAPAAAAIREIVDGPWSANPPTADALADHPLLTPAADYVDLAFPEPTVERDEGGTVAAVKGVVLVVDDFGNAITNVPGDLLRELVGRGDGSDADDDDGSDDGNDVDDDGNDDDEGYVRVNDDPVPLVDTFAAVQSGDPLVTVGSHGYAECDVNDGRGDEAFGLAAGDPVVFGRGR